MASTAVQDAIPHNHCWGCGTLNPNGLHIKSYVEGEETVCRFQPRPEHSAGETHVVNGGIIAALVDCHGVCTAVADAYRVAGRELGSDPLLWHVTGALHVDYLLPTPIDRPIVVRARVVERKGRKRIVVCSVRSDELETARGQVVAIAVPAA